MTAARQTSLFDSPQRLAYEELMSTKCVCGAAKRKQQSFCAHDYWRLPQDLRDRLWQGFSSGYVIAYEDAKRWFMEHPETK